MKRAPNVVEIILGILLLISVILILKLIVPSFTPHQFMAQPKTFDIDAQKAYPQPMPVSSMYPPPPSMWSPYPPPGETSSTSTLVIVATATPLKSISTQDLVSITPFPTLTLKPGSSPTLLPILGPAADAAGTIFFVAKKSAEKKTNINYVILDPNGKKTGPTLLLSNDEVKNEGSIFPSPDGHYLAIRGNWGDLSIYDTDKAKYEKLSMTMGPDAMFFNWFPDGQHILWGGSTLVLTNPFRGEESTLVVPGYGGITGAAASPDGQYVVYGYDNHTLYEPGIWVINVNGQNPHLLSPGVSPSYIAWSPDGKKIAFFGMGWQVIDADGSNLREIAPGIPCPNCYFLPPFWSPDSRILAVVTSKTGQAFCSGKTEDLFQGTNIVLIDVESGQARPLLLDGSTGNIAPTWSPDGSHIAFVSNRSGTPEIWVVNVDGSDLRQLTENDQLTLSPIWTRTK